MPRPRRLRRVRAMPDIDYFKPAGVKASELNQVVLTVDEYEAVRLKDFQGMEQNEAAKKMNISQPTFNRLLASARKKISDAIINGKAIKIEGGSYKMVQPRGRGMGFGGPAEYCVCPKCRTRVQKKRTIPCAEMQCPECGALMTRG